MVRVSISILKKEAKKNIEEEGLEKFEEEAIETIRRAKKRRVLLRTKKEKRIFREITKEYKPEIHGPLIEFTPPPGWKVIEEYWIEEHFCKIFILYNEDEQDYWYFVAEPKLSPYEMEVYAQIYLLMRDELERISISDGMEKEAILQKIYTKVLNELGINLDEKGYAKIFYYLERDLIGYGKINAMVRDRMLEDISCNGYRKPLYVYHRSYTNLRTNVVFEDESELDSFVINLAQKCGKHLSIAEPMVDATMPDGSRIQLTLGKEVTDHGSTFTIRKFREEPCYACGFDSLENIQLRTDGVSLALH
jgi:flagellar protein FlaI